MSDHKVKIISTDIETFKKIEKKLKEFPDHVLSQIDSAEVGLAGYTFHLFPYSLPKQLYLPGLINMKIEETGIMAHTLHGWFRWDRSESYRKEQYDVTVVNVNLDEKEKS